MEAEQKAVQLRWFLLRMCRARVAMVVTRVCGGSWWRGTEMSKGWRIEAEGEGSEGREGYEGEGREERGHQIL